VLLRNRSLRFRETEFCEQRQRRQNSASFPKRILQRPNAACLSPRIRGFFARRREISVSARVRGGAERTRTPCQAGSSIEPVSVTAPMLQARAHRAVAKVGPYAANPNQHRCRCTVRLDPAIKRRRTAQRHCREMTGNPLRLERYCRQFPGAKGAPRSCPAGPIAVAGLRWCGGRREPNGGSQCPNLPSSK